jgi:hypothetical protein
MLVLKHKDIQSAVERETEEAIEKELSVAQAKVSSFLFDVKNVGYV